MAGSLGFGRQYCIPKGKASAEYRFGWLERLETKTATEFRYLRWGLGIVIALVLGLVTKVILDWLMRTSNGMTTLMYASHSSWRRIGSEAFAFR
jgi:hypothetical protein